MKEVIYTLKTEIDGVKELVLRAPTRKQLKFAAAVKSAFMSVAVEMAANMNADEAPANTDSPDVVMNGDAMLMALYAGSADVAELLDRFLSACTGTPMCQMNGGDVPDGFFDTMEMRDIEGLFSTFLENFITT